MTKTVERPKAVSVRNPAALDCIAKAVEAGYGRNLSEAAENLIIRGFESAQRDAQAKGDPDLQLQSAPSDG